MSGSTSVGNLNVKVTASAAQFTAIMEDMQRQADAVGGKMAGAGAGMHGMADAAEHAHIMTNRMAMSMAHAGTMMGEKGLAGGMEAAVHAAGHLALHMGAAMAPTIGLMIGVNLVTEQFKHMSHEMEKAAEKANSMADALKKLAEAGKDSEFERKVKTTFTVDKAEEDRDKKKNEIEDLQAERKKALEDIHRQEKIINRTKGVWNTFKGGTVKETMEANAKTEAATKVKEELEKKLKEINNEINKKGREADAMDGIAELPRRLRRRVIGRQLVVGRRLAVGAPLALEGAGVGVEDDDAVICRTNLPSAVNLRIWPSVAPLPPSQTKPLGSI